MDHCHLQGGQCEPVDVRGGDRVVCVFVIVVVSVMDLPSVCMLATSIPTRACPVVGGCEAGTSGWGCIRDPLTHSLTNSVRPRVVSRSPMCPS